MKLERVSYQGGDKKVVVAMSGGVDSAASALLLRELGYDVIGVSMQVWDYRSHGGSTTKRTCCAPDDFADARLVADRFGFPYYVFDFEESFRTAVIDKFISSYLQGRTPNPCLDCNRKVKFKELRGRSASLGIELVSTGHYARILKKTDDLGQESFGLYTARDCQKDQSYFLYAMGQEELRSTIFPVGDMTKAEVRAYLQEQGLEIASKGESQDICFVATTVGDFIAKELQKRRENMIAAGKDVGNVGSTVSGEGQDITDLEHSAEAVNVATRGAVLMEQVPAAGKIVTVSGEVLGAHEGIHNFTVGQRKGLRVSSANPLYVLQIDAAANRIVVGEKKELERESFIVEDVSWTAGLAKEQKSVVLAKLRYRHDGERCLVEMIDEHRAKVTFLEESSPVSPGQAAVFYATECESAVEVYGGEVDGSACDATVDGGGLREVLGGGIIAY